MSGTKTFDQNYALEQAMRLFWAKGFEAASISDLERVTGLNRSSLYNAFGDKEALFAAALERYSERLLSTILPSLEGTPVVAAIRNLLEAFDRALTASEAPGGCLVYVTIFERGQGPEATAVILKRHVGRVRRALLARLSAAVATGELRDAAAAGELMALGLAALAGLATLSRLRAPAQERGLLVSAVAAAIAARAP